MPENVVGSAFVVIRAITRNLAKDIERQVKKGIEGANLDKIGADAGDDLGENLGENAMSSAKKTIKRRSRGVFQDVADEARRTSSELFNVFGDLPFADNTSILDKFKLKLNSVDNSIRDFVLRTKAGFRSMAKIDKDSGFGDALERIGQKLQKFGEGGFSEALSKIPLGITAIGAAIVGSLPFIQDIGATILAYATGLVAQIGFLVTALGGLGVAAGAAIGSTATLILPLTLAFKAETEALLEFKDSAKAAGEEFLTIGVATQQTLLPALDEALFILQDLVAPLSEFGLFVGRAVGNFSLFFATVLTGEEALGRFQAILQSALRIFDLLTPAIINVGDVLSGIWVAAIPASERLVASIAEIAERLAETVSEGLRTGELTRKFDLWYDRAAVLGSALGDVAAALFNILEIGADSSDSLFERFDEFSERYRAFTESETGKNRIALIFDNALAVMREINGVAADLFDGIFGRLGDIGGVDSLVGALQKFRDVLPGIQEQFQDMLGTIREVVDFIFDNFKGKVGQAIDKLAEPLGRLAFQILDLLKAMEESGAFEIFLDLLRIMTNVLSTLLAIPGFGTFIGYMLAFGSAAKIAKLALGPFIGVLGSFIVQVGQLVAVKSGEALTGTATALTRFALGFKGAAAIAPAAGEAIAGATATVAANAGGASGALGKAVASAAAFAGPLGIGLAVGALAIGGIAFYRHQQQVQAWRQEVRQATEALGLLNGGLLISVDGIKKYIEETSRFADNDALQGALANIGFSIQDVAEGVDGGTLSLQEFSQAALDAGEARFRLSAANTGVSIPSEIDTFRRLQEQFELTDEQLQELIDTQTVFSDSGRLTIESNEDIIGAFVELQRVIGQGVKDNINSFVLDQTNIDLLGPVALAKLKADIDSIGSETAETAIPLMQGALDDLGEAATEASAGLIGVSEETRRQVEEQVSGISDANVAATEAYKLLLREQQKVFAQIQNDFELFNSESFAEEFGDAKQAVLDFSEVVENEDFSQFDDAFAFGLEGFLVTFPEVGAAAQDLFATLATLPEDEFNAAATAMGADADDLRVAMDGANQAILDLQNQAVASLPTIGSLLQGATEVREDGTQFFDPDAFLQGARERIAETSRFSENIAEIQRVFGSETARLAAQQGPAAAEAFREMAGSDPKSVNQVIADMEAADTALRTQISDVLGPAIAAEYAIAAGLIGPDFTIGLAQGLNSPVAVAALVNVGGDLAAQVAEQLDFFLIPTEDGFRAVRRVTRSNAGGTGRHSFFSDGGFVDNKPTFGGGPFGTDTVNAWLTPGEFVLRRSVAQSIPRNILTALNDGDTRMLGLLNGLNKSRPQGVDAVVASVTATVPGRAAANSGFVIEQMNIEAPTPLETSRQVADRLRIMQSQLSNR